LACRAARPTPDPLRRDGDDRHHCLRVSRGARSGGFTGRAGRGALTGSRALGDPGAAGNQARPTGDHSGPQPCETQQTQADALIHEAIETIKKRYHDTPPAPCFATVQQVQKIELTQPPFALAEALRQLEKERAPALH